MEKTEITTEQLSFSYDPSLFSARRKEASLDNRFIGQPRAVEALHLGMSLFSKNYNIFLSGDPGSGRHEAIRKVAANLGAPSASDLHDIAFAYNFLKPQSPLTLTFCAGQGAEFAKSMDAVSNLVSENDYQSAIQAINALLDTTKALEQDHAQKPQDCDRIQTYLLSARSALSKGTSRKLEPDQFKLNLVINRALETDRTSRPLVFESHPTQANLFGQVSDRSPFLHLSLCPGSVIDACDGFLAIDAEQLLNQAGLWDNLKKFLDFGTLLIHRNAPGLDSFIIKPTPITAPVKVILIGTDAIYDKLCEIDESFLDLFNISAEFDFSMPATGENILATVGYIDRIVKSDSLLPISDDGISRLLFYSSWFAEQRNELTTKLSYLADLVHEAHYWASLDHQDQITARSIDRAIDQRNYMNSLTETKINEEITSGEMIISLSGSKVGVINGLAIMDRGNASFGTPTVISVSVAPGTEGIVNIEHEAGLSGEIHDKGLLILEGYLRKHYAKSFPLSMYAGICFEQSYAEVDGDSASSAELFALLSAIGDIPLRQEIAATGSVNQLGDIQPVGGINEKITGFFKICSITGLTGHQGVIIPRQNLSSLLLPDDLLSAISAGKFHIYAIQTIDEGMEILTNRPSGQRTAKGTFPPRTINSIIENQLKNLCTLSRPAT